LTLGSALGPALAQQLRAEPAPTGAARTYAASLTGGAKPTPHIRRQSRSASNSSLLGQIRGVISVMNRRNTLL